MSSSTLKLLQLNMGRTSVVNDQLLCYAQDNHIDIALVQEPYTCRGILTGLEARPLRRILSVGTHPPGSTATQHGAGIVIFNPRLIVTARNDLATNNFAVATLELKNGNIIHLISAYLKYRTPTTNLLNELDAILRSLRHPYVISADINAFSKMWYSRITDTRGTYVEDFIARHNLLCLNQPSPHYTFSGPRGNTNIDITLVHRALLPLVVQWEVIPGETSSDHSILRYNIDLKPSPFTNKPTRFALNRADWDRFNAAVAVSSSSVDTNLDIHSLAKAINDAVLCAAEAAIPKCRPPNKLKPPWWTPEVVAARRALRALAKNLDRGNQAAMNIYRAARNRLNLLLRTAKIASWRHFCTAEGSMPWGKLYKWLKKGPTVSAIHTTLTKPDGSQTETMSETVSVLLDTLVPHEPQQLANLDLPPPPYAHEAATEIEVRAADWGISPNKAPGADCVSARFLRHAWMHIRELVVTLANSCLSQGVFPDCLKHADVVVIPKGRDKDPTSPKSYRPISLLPVLGKVLEKLICNRLTTQIRTRVSTLQYGFTKGRSTMDAIGDLLSWSSAHEGKHTLCVFLDISGAFDTILWSALHSDIEALGADHSIRAVIHSYLSRRSASITTGGVTSSVTLTKGCPQGSLLGPLLWNVTMENLLLTPLDDFARIQAYADDIAITVYGNSRAQIINRAASVLQRTLDWGDLRGLTFSASKSTALTIKGNLVPGFTIPFGNARITTVPAAKYLGVILDNKLSFKPHLAHLRERNLDLFSRLRGATGTNWGYKHSNLTLLYRAVFVPRLAYGITLWVDSITKSVAYRQLFPLQRKALLAITSAYRTASTEALQVIAGTLPIDLELRLTVVRARSSTLPLADQRDLISAARDNALCTWQQRWDQSSKGRWTHSLLPSVRLRLDTPIWLNHHIVQFLTGHGDFRAKLHGFNLVEDPNCPCNLDLETPEHILFSCPRFSLQREHLIRATSVAGHPWPCRPHLFLTSRSLYSALDKFASLVLAT